MPLSISATIMLYRTPLTAAFWRSASTAAHSKTSLPLAAAFSKAVTMAPSAPAVVIPWRAGRRGRAVLVVSSQPLWTCPWAGDTLSCCAGAWGATAAYLAKAGGSILFKCSAKDRLQLQPRLQQRHLRRQRHLRLVLPSLPHPHRLQRRG